MSKFIWSVKYYPVHFSTNRGSENLSLASRLVGFEKNKNKLKEDGVGPFKNIYIENLKI